MYIKQIHSLAVCRAMLFYQIKRVELFERESFRYRVSMKISQIQQVFNKRTSISEFKKLIANEVDDYKRLSPS
jgi:hypothetical protein